MQAVWNLGARVLQSNNIIPELGIQENDPNNVRPSFQK